MRNRAKCKLCQSIIESFHIHDYVTCTCGEISVDGGRSYFKVIAKDFNNFLRLDDEGKEIPLKVIQEENLPTNDDAVNNAQNPIKVPKSKVLKLLKEMSDSYENLPQNAMLAPVTHYDLHSLVLILSSVVESLADDSPRDS